MGQENTERAEAFYKRQPGLTRKKVTAAKLVSVKGQTFENSGPYK